MPFHISASGEFHDIRIANNIRPSTLERKIVAKFFERNFDARRNSGDTEMRERLLAHKQKHVNSLGQYPTWVVALPDYLHRYATVTIHDGDLYVRPVTFYRSYDNIHKEAQFDADSFNTPDHWYVKEQTKLREAREAKESEDDVEKAIKALLKSNPKLKSRIIKTFDTKTNQWLFAISK